MKQLQVEEQQYKIDQQGKLAIAAPHEYKKLRSKGKLISVAAYKPNPAGAKTSARPGSD